MRNFTYLLSIIFIFLIPCENTITVGDFGTLNRTIGVLLASTWLFSVLKNGVFRKFQLFHIIAFLFILWNITSAFWSIDLDETLSRIKTYLQLGILTCILWDLYRTNFNIRAALQAYIFGGYILILSTFYNFYIGHEIGGRFAATGFNPNDLSLNLALGIPLAFYIAFDKSINRKAKYLQLLNYAYIILAILAILLTASRGSFIATVPAIFYIIVSLRRFNPFFGLLILIATSILIFIMLPLVPQFNYHRLSTIPNSIIEGDLGGRIYIWNTTIDYFCKHPLIGTGSGALPSVHNVFLSVLAETGLIGFSLFVLLYFNSIYAALQHKNNDSFVWLTVLAVWTLGAFVHNWEHRKATWLFLNLAVISAFQSYEYCSSIWKSDKINKLFNHN